jgi:uncharacterized membrane protein
MKKHIRILMSGVLIVIPLAATAWVVSWITHALAGLGEALLQKTTLDRHITPDWHGWAIWLGLLGALIALYLVGLMARFWLFQRIFDAVDRLLSHLPGIKTIYESIRDLLKLFGGDAGRMGRVVLYSPPGSGMKLLGIVTNENPLGRPDGDNSVIVYLPLGYMIGGPIVYARPDSIEPVDMPVETALKLAATAFIGTDRIEATKPATAPPPSSEPPTGRGPSGP